MENQSRQCMQNQTLSPEQRPDTQTVPEIISFGFWMRKQGFKDSSIRSAIAALKAVARKVDIFSTEAVKSYLANANLSETEIFSLIFLPGFSTAKKVTNISGRGVGMDVVKTNIERVNGSVDLESAPGKVRHEKATGWTSAPA